jgi:hypothetical protein
VRNVEEDKGHHIAYQKVLAAAQTYEHPPLFLSEDCDQITSEPGKAEEVANWMCIAERVATGNRKRVLEDGPDTWCSDDEAKEDVEADKELGMYTSEMDPKKGPKKLSQAEAARQRAIQKTVQDFRQASRELKSHAPEQRQPTPLTSPVNSDDEEMSEDQRRMVNRGKRMAQRGVPKAQKGQVPVGKRLTEGQESPEAKASHPMVTRGRASGAGSLRGVVGSGQTDTRVASGNPSKT